MTLNIRLHDWTKSSLLFLPLVSLLISACEIGPSYIATMKPVVGSVKPQDTPYANVRLGIVLTENFHKANQMTGGWSEPSRLSKGINLILGTRFKDVVPVGAVNQTKNSNVDLVMLLDAQVTWSLGVLDSSTATITANVMDLEGNPVDQVSAKGHDVRFAGPVMPAVNAALADFEKKLDGAKKLLAAAENIRGTDTARSVPPQIAITQFRQQQVEIERLKQETKLTKQKLELERTRRELELEKAKTEAARLRQEPPRIIATAVDQAKLSDFSNIDFGKYYALVIGNNAYEHLPDLKTATNDAKTVAKLLQDEYGFNVSLLINARREEILDALDVYREKLGNTDNLLIYYAGHGWLDKAGEQGYWLPIDAQENRRSKWISNTAISTTLKALEAKHVMVVADSCYSGTLVRGLKIRGKTGDYIKRMTEKRARVVLTSGGLEPVADLGGGGHSPFAKAFVDVLSANTSVMDGTSMFSELRRLVILSADQTPEYSDARKAGHDGGDFLFVRKK